MTWMTPSSLPLHQPTSSVYRVLLLVSVALGMLTLGTPVWGQSSARQLLRQAGANFKQGKKLAIQRQFSDALRYYRQALRLTARAKTLTTNPRILAKIQRIKVTLFYIMAQTYSYNKEYREAVDFYKRCLQSNPTEKIRRKASSNLATLRQKLKATLRFVSTPPGALILLKGRYGRTPFTIQVPYGSLSFEVQHKGYQSKRMSVEAQPGQSQTINITLEPLAVANTPRPEPRPSTETSPKWPTVAMWTGMTTGIATGLASFALILVARLEFAEVSTKAGQPLESLENLKAQRDRGVVLQNAGIIFALLAVTGGVISVVAALQPKPKPKEIPSPNADDPTTGRVTIFSTHPANGRWVRRP